MRVRDVRQQLYSRRVAALGTHFCTIGLGIPPLQEVRSRRFVGSFINFAAAAHARGIESAGYVTPCQTHISPHLERVVHAHQFSGVLAIDRACARHRSATLLETSHRLGERISVP
jgi:hypothetical protein